MGSAVQLEAITMSSLSKTLFAVLAALVLAVTYAFAHTSAVQSNNPATPPHALTVEEVRALFNLDMP